MVTFPCSLCDQPAGTLSIEGTELRRVSFTSVLTQPVPAGFALPGGARALHALDPELAPFFCPDCDASYCGGHWERWDVFDEDGFHDCIRGRCPEGHVRLLED